MPTKKKKQKGKKSKPAKKAKPVKKAKAKAKPAAKPQAQSKALAIMPQLSISIDEILKPERYRGKLSIVPTPLTEKQILAIVAPTPKNIIKTRPGKGGGNWDYIPGWWFKKKLNFITGFLWNFEILSERLDGDYITVKGRLEIIHHKTLKPMLHKDDFGGAEVKYKKGQTHEPKNYLDLANDFKAAATDCLKRCAVQLGLGMDVYATGEHKEMGGVVIDNGPTPPPQNPAPASRPNVRTIEATVVSNTNKYQQKLDEYLEQKGLHNVKDKADFIKKKTTLVVDYKNINPLMAQTVLAHLMRAAIEK